VEDLSQRTESTSTFVNPDGTWTTEDHGSPIRVMQDGDWHDVDLDLVKQADGTWVPNVSPADVVVDGGGSSEAGKVSFGDGTSLAVTWPDGTLPTPTVEGGVATYKVSDTTDLLVTMTNEGLNTWLRLNEKPTDTDPVFTFGLKADGVDVDQHGTGLTVTDEEGKNVGGTGQLVAWDAQTDADGMPTNVVPLDADLNDVAAKGDVTKSELDLTAPDGFLDDPDTQYPVIIDPNITVGRAYDTWVASGVTTSQISNIQLVVGNSTVSANTEARSLLKWDSDKYAGKSILSATMKLYEFEAGSCSPRQTNVHMLGGAFGSSTVWTNRPSVLTDTGGSTSFTTNIGGSGCSTSNGWVSVDLTKMVSLWAAGTYANNGLVLNVPTANIDDHSYVKRFCSMTLDASETTCQQAEERPILTVTYNTNPGAAAAPTVKATGTVVGYTSATKPLVSTTATDAEGQQVKYTFEVHPSTSSSTVSSSCVTGLVSSGASGSCTLGTALAAGTYSVRAKATDATNLIGAWSGWTTMVVDNVAPGAPAIAASALTNGGWVNPKPASNTFTFTGASDTVSFQYLKDAATAWTSLAASSAKATLSWVDNGAHKLQVKAIDKAGNVSAVSTFTYGTGGAALSAPTVSGIKSTNTVKVAATGPTASTGTVTPKIMWRVRGGGEDASFDALEGTAAGWKTASTLPAIAAGTAVSVASTLDVAAVAADPSVNRPRKATVMDVQVCFTYTSPAQTRCTWNADVKTHATATFVPHAFGDGFPTSAAGPGQVALWTGEFQMSASDISVPGYTGDLSISRSYATFDGDAAAGGVFGPGWKASIDGTDAGAAGLDVSDDTTFDGTISLIDDEGNPLTYAQPGTSREPRKAGVYTPVDADTAEAGGRLQVASSTTSMTYTDAEGTITTWTYTSGAWQATSVQEPGDPGTTTFTRDGAGRVIRIVAPIPPAGDSTPVTCATGQEMPGCRVLTITYGTTNTVPDRIGQVKQVSYTAYNTAKTGGAGMDTVPVANYEYDSSGRLTKVTDPRVNLSAAYTYGANSAAGVPLLASLTPPGQAPYTFTYASPASGYTTALDTVGRGAPTAGGSPATLSAYRYVLPLTAAGLPLLSSSVVGGWGQQDVPTRVFAVFGQDKAGTVAATPASGDMAYADLQFTDDDGYVLNTANYGTGGWQYTATGYDAAGNVIRELDQRATSQIRAALAAGLGVDADSYATITRYNADITATSAITAGGATIDAGSLLTPAGTLITDVWDPTAEVTASDGTVSLRRQHTHNDYDQGAPNSGVNPDTGVAYRLPTRATVTSAEPSTGSSDLSVPVATGEPVLTLTKIAYDPIDSTSDTAPSSGWTIGSVTSSSIDMDLDATTTAGDIVTRSRFDDEGRTVETRQPKSNGADAGTTVTGYYSVGSQPGVNSLCGGKPQWAGLVCRVAKADASASTVTMTSGYNMYLTPTTVIETRGDVTRTTTTTFDASGRPSTVATTASGLPDSTAVPTTKTIYDPTTGAATATASLNAGGTETGRISTGFDLWGRTTTYTDSDGLVTTTSYDSAGRTSTIVDPKGTTTNTYDGPTGQLRTQTVTDATAGTQTFTATYNEAGDILTQGLPGGVTQISTYDRTGQQAELGYRSAIGDIANWEQGFDLLGRVISVGGPSSTGGSRDTRYTYDNAARLSTAADTSDGTCSTRDYAFDPNGNRTGMTISTYDNGCMTTATAVVARTWTYDAADRVQSGANSTANYVYDQLGRQTTIPATDTPAGPDAGELSINYYDTDAAHDITQDGVTTTYQLDPAGRRSTSTTAADSTTSTVRHYTNESDTPAWTDATGAGSTRYMGAISGDLAATLTSGSIFVSLVSPHGDVATTLAVSVGSSALGGWSAYDEYGNPQIPDSTGGDQTYAWLGGKQRATDGSGLGLMGARLYNPTQGSFTSTDPVVDGNTTSYAYPQDPVNQFDLTGKWCHWQVGTTCTRYIKDAYGRYIPVQYRFRKKVETKHNIDWATQKWLIPLMRQSYGGSGTAVVYRVTINEQYCTKSIYSAQRCRPTGRSVTVKMVVDFKSQNGKTFGLVTMYCEIPGTTLCPNWINTNRKYRG